ncbi:hypothetical protein [Vibrio navarrensis]|uniref:hypothetical protein n=1 Tax=Vibrio navarrensis TaxID=29495 RepID=UPI001302635F|nr:hypothetical protein [Vibrio navarrensis]
MKKLSFLSMGLVLTCLSSASYAQQDNPYEVYFVDQALNIQSSVLDVYDGYLLLNTRGLNIENSYNLSMNVKFTHSGEDTEYYTHTDLQYLERESYSYTHEFDIPEGALSSDIVEACVSDSSNPSAEPVCRSALLLSVPKSN